MSTSTHLEVSWSMVGKIVGILLAAIIGLGVYIYQGDEKITRASLKSNQEAIQMTLDNMKENEKQIAVGKVRMDGHTVNLAAHSN